MTQAHAAAETTDVVVIGSGVGGLTTALLAAAYGLNVVVLEKSDLVGGATAYAAGGAFLPGCHHLPPEPDPTAPFTYLAACAGNAVNRPMLEAYLSNGPTALAELEAHTEVRYQATGSLDYRMEMPGAARVPRTVLPVPFDGSVLGAALAKLRPPLPTMTILGGMQVDYGDIDRLTKALRSPAAMAYAVGLIARHILGRVRRGRSPRLVFGNALAGRLFKSALDRAIPIRTATCATGLIVEGGRVTGVNYRDAAGAGSIRATRGVMLASGGFPANAAMRAERLEFAAQHRSLPPRGNTGDGIAMAVAAGARLDQSMLSSYCMTPVSCYTAANGEEMRFPHFAFDRCKPGAIAVGPDGRRFVNEGCVYSEFAAEMHRLGAVPAYLICDHAFLRKYGLGMVLPAPFAYRPFIKRNYLVQGSSIMALAAKLGIDGPALRDTVARANDYARTGKDLEFQKGEDGYSRSVGDPAHRPNPCLGPIARAPFYAITLYPGDTATTCGLVVNTRAQVLDRDDRPIPGLYACGPDMANPTMGTNPSGGCNIGPALTFGYIAARHMADARASMSGRYAEPGDDVLPRGGDGWVPAGAAPLAARPQVSVTAPPS